MEQKAFVVFLKTSLLSKHPNLWNLCVALHETESLIKTQQFHVTRKDRISKENCTEVLMTDLNTSCKYLMTMKF